MIEFLTRFIAPSSSTASPVLPLVGDWAFGAPWFLVFAPLLWVLQWLVMRRRGFAGSGGLPLLRLPRSLRQNTAFVPAVAAALAALMLALALARPIRTNSEESDTSQGIDILLVVDRSSSMRARDMEATLGTGRTRLEVVREVALDFARRRTNDRGFARDSVGLMTFAAYPELLCPLTLDFSALASFAGGLDVVRNQSEDGTRIGAALAKSVQLLRTSESKSRVVVLLSDGEETPGPVIEPLEAADFAAKEGIKVYTILAGQRKVQSSLLSPELLLTKEDLDETQMRAIAERAGGHFYRARDREQLEDIYATIEELERTPRVTATYVDAQDYYRPFLLAALLTQAFAVLCSATVWRRTLA